MLASLLMLAASGQRSLHVGPYELSYDTGEQLIRVNNSGKTAFWAHAHNASFLAAFSPEGGRLVISTGNHVTAYNKRGDDVWSRVLEYDFPAFLCAATSQVAYDQGRPVGAPKNYGSLQKWRRALDRQARVMCVNARDGGVAWNRPWSEVGAPLVGWGRNFWCAAFPVQEWYQGKIGHWYAQEVSGTSGRVIHRWRFDNPPVGSVDCLEAVSSAARVEIDGRVPTRVISMPEGEGGEPLLERARFTFDEDGSCVLRVWAPRSNAPTITLLGRNID